ncbi:hypothetical protein [Phenylobacterium sp. SCN 70-31]|uniref:hypothetical protein n=1 Tax=Phenylobacterium sp. SCN 70-31 TaxID=1660129 RepID=UPI0025D684E5|nr:hypothetical protein [Phenylobacterium sp. SCN 70-31]
MQYTFEPKVDGSFVEPTPTKSFVQSTVEQYAQQVIPNLVQADFPMGRKVILAPGTKVQTEDGQVIALSDPTAVNLAENSPNGLIPLFSEATLLLLTQYVIDKTEEALGQGGSSGNYSVADATPFEDMKNAGLNRKARRRQGRK